MNYCASGYPFYSFFLATDTILTYFQDVNAALLCRVDEEIYLYVDCVVDVALLGSVVHNDEISSVENVAPDRTKQCTKKQQQGEAQE